MKRPRYSESQIVKILKEIEGGRLVNEVRWEYGISDATYYLYGLPSYCKHFLP